MDLPIPFLKNLEQLLPSEEQNVFLEALGSETPVSIRLNSGKPVPFSQGQWTSVPWCAQGYYLPTRPTFTFDPLFHAGCYYVQEASSMFLDRVVRTYVHEAVIALDLCAAPGGKSTLLLNALPDGSLLVSNEVKFQRAQVLAENIIKWGNPSTVVTHSDSEDFSALTHVFDLILADVPCSGEGMFRKDPMAVQEWSLENVETCWRRQRTILQNIWSALKPGGILVYSTCTFNLQEDEENINWLHNTFGAEILEVPVEREWKITGSLGGYHFPVYRFLPHKTVGEGLFMVVLRKPESENTEVSPSRKKDNRKKDKRVTIPPIPKECKSWLKGPDRFDVQLVRDRIVAFPKNHAELYKVLLEQLNVLHAGVAIGTIKGKDIIPEHSLAMSQVVAEVFPRVEITYKQAIAYLRKESITLNGVPRGFILLTYREQPLGFVKNIGNRVNNLYPQEWRIRTGFTPEQVITL